MQRWMRVFTPYIGVSQHDKFVSFKAKGGDSVRKSGDKSDRQARRMVEKKSFNTGRRINNVMG